MSAIEGFRYLLEKIFNQPFTVHFVEKGGYMVGVGNKCIIELTREYKADCTMGDLVINGINYKTLEPPNREKTGGVKPYCVEEGLYRITMEYSPRYDKRLPELKNTGDITECKIHRGNFVKNTLACILPGRTAGENYVNHSLECELEICKAIEAMESKGTEVFIRIKSK